MLINYKAHLVDGSIDKSNKYTQIYVTKATQKQAKKQKHAEDITQLPQENAALNHTVQAVGSIASKLKVKVTLCAFHSIKLQLVRYSTRSWLTCIRNRCVSEW